MAFLCNMNSTACMGFLNNKYNVYKNKTSISDRNMHPHMYVSARGSNPFPLVRTRGKLTDAHSPQLV